MSKWYQITGIFLVVMLAVAGCSTFKSSSKMDEPAAEMDEMVTEMEQAPAEKASHSYGIAEFPESLGVPSVEVEIFPDPGTGWNVHVITENFIFSPEHAGAEHYPGEGHAHLYVDGRKIARMYGPWYHLDEQLDVGDHEVEVTLNSNDHNLYTYDGNIVETQTVLTVEPE
jgi:hypothetical protein